MAILTTEEIQAAMADLYKAKQALHALDRQFNQQAAAIMNQARQDVETLRASLAAQRTALMATVEATQKTLDEGK
jgi:hypothetical protein